MKKLNTPHTIILFACCLSLSACQNLAELTTDGAVPELSILNVKGIEADPADSGSAPPAAQDAVSLDKNYYIAVSYYSEESADVSPDALKQVIVTAAVGNMGGAPLAIAVSDLTLIDVQGQRFVPNVPSGMINPSIIGSVIDMDESVYGFVDFTIPKDSVPHKLEWCIAKDKECMDTLEAYIPSNS